MSGYIDWEAIPENEYQAYLKRLEIVELIFDGTVDPQTKRRERERYCEENGVTMRTVANYVSRYRRKGRIGLLFYRPRPIPERVHDKELGEKIIELVHELPSRSVPALRRLLSEDEVFSAKIQCVSNRTIYRFLCDNGLSGKQRSRLLREDGRRAYRVRMSSRIPGSAVNRIPCLTPGGAGVHPPHGGDEKFSKMAFTSCL